MNHPRRRATLTCLAAGLLTAALPPSRLPPIPTSLSASSFHSRQARVRTSSPPDRPAPYAARSGKPTSSRTRLGPAASSAPPSPPRPRRTDTRSTWDRAARWPSALMSTRLWASDTLKDFAPDLQYRLGHARVVTAPARNWRPPRMSWSVRALNPGWFPKFGSARQWDDQPSHDGVVHADDGIC